MDNSLAESFNAALKREVLKDAKTFANQLICRRDVFRWCVTTVLNKEVTADEINAAFKEAFSNTEYYGYNEDGIVSSDIIGDTHGGVFDPTQT